MGEKYFVLHAPRQTGKTSILLALAERINADDKYRCLYINVEAAQAYRDDIDSAIPIVLSELGKRALIVFGDGTVRSLIQEVLTREPAGMALNQLLTDWAAADPKPLVLLVDEIDTLIGDSLISVLRQLRSGYDLRPTHFPQSVILCGVRDVRDYRIFSAKDQNLHQRRQRLQHQGQVATARGISRKRRCARCWRSTRAETGQVFEDRATERIWELTLGQPWLVNALAQQVCFEERSGLDRSRAIGATVIDAAKETLILDRVTHLDQLAARLAEGRVRRVIEPMLAGGEPRHSPTDLEYVRDLGLVAQNEPVRIANPIYAEVVPRELTQQLQGVVDQDVTPFLDAAGDLRINQLLEGFQKFYRENSEHSLKWIGYKEAGAQLVLQAFLQRVINGGRAHYTGVPVGAAADGSADSVAAGAGAGTRAR